MDEQSAEAGCNTAQGCADCIRDVECSHSKHLVWKHGDGRENCRAKKEITAKQYELEVLRNLEQSYLETCNPGTHGDERQRVSVGMSEMRTGFDGEQRTDDFMSEL